jgi:hypothetical protein
VKTLKFERLAVYGVKSAWNGATVCPDSDAEFFSIYGLLRNVRGTPDYICVGDFGTRDEAELVVDLLVSSHRLCTRSNDSQQRKLAAHRDSDHG